MKLRLPHKFQAALLAALASVSFTTLSTGTLGAAFFVSGQAFAEDAEEEPSATIDIGDTNLDAQAAMEEEEGTAETKEPGSAPINEAGFNGGPGNNAGLLITESVDIDETELDTVASSEPVAATSGSADSTPSDNLGFTANPYATGSDTSNGSDDFSLTGTAPAAAYVPGQSGISAEEGDSAAGTGSGSSTNKTTTGAIGSIGGTGSGATGGRAARPMALTAPNMLSPVSSPSVGGTSLGGDSGSLHELATLGAADEETATRPAYSGTILTWNGTTSGTDLAYGKYLETTYDSATGTFSEGTEKKGWTNPVQGLIGTNDNNNRNTLRFAGDYGQTVKTPVYTFSPLALAGFIVDTGATDFSVNSKITNPADRIFYLGNNNTTAALSSINENFTFNMGAGNGKVYLRGTQTIDVAEGKVFTLGANNGMELTSNLNMTLAGGGTMMLRTNADVTSDAASVVTLAEDSTLQVRADGATRTYSFNNLEVSGSGHLSIADSGTGGQGYQATVNIGNLSNADSSSAVLSLGNAARSSGSVININGGSFNGEIVVRGEATAGTRKTAVQLGDATVARNAVVSFDVLSGKSGNNNVGLGIGTDVFVKGINTASAVDSTIYSGSKSAGFSDFNSGSDRYSITITGEGSYSTTATVKNKLNLVMSGTGTQAFSGNMSAFDGSITVNSGTLTLGSAVAGASIVSVAGGTLDLGAALTTTGNVTVGSTGTLRLSSGGSLASGGSLSLSGATLDLNNRRFKAGTSYTLATASGSIAYDNLNLANYTMPTGSTGYTLSGDNNALTLTFDGENPVVNTLHIYLLTGQSNSMGAVKGDPASAAMLAEYASGIQMWDGNMAGSVTDPSADTANKAWNDTGKTWFTVQPQQTPAGKGVAGPADTPYEHLTGQADLRNTWGGSTVMGPEYGFSYMMEKQGWDISSGSSDLAIVKVSRDGGQNFYWDPDDSRSIYPQILDTVIKAVLAADSSKYTDISLDGLMYLQGESGDATQGNNARNVVTKLITRLQADLNAAKNPGGRLAGVSDVLTVSIGDSIILGEPALMGGSSNPTATVFKAWAGEDAHAGFVYTRDLGLINPGDGMNVHYDGNSQITIGARYAYTLAQVQGLDTTENGTVRVRSQYYGDSALSETSPSLNDSIAWWQSSGDKTAFVSTSSLANTVAVWNVSSANMGKTSQAAETLSSDLALGGIRIEDPYSDDENPGDHKATITINNASGTGEHTLSVGAEGIKLQQGNLTVNTNLTATANQTWNTNDTPANGSAQQNTLNLTGTTTIADGATVTIEGASIVNISALAGTGGLTVNGAGAVVTLTDKTGFTGATTVTSGSLKIDGTDNLDITGDLTINGGSATFAGNITADTVTLSNIGSGQGSFVTYNGTITGKDSITLNNYTVADMNASLVTQRLVAMGGTSTTIRNLTLTACEVNVDSGSDLTLAGHLTLGDTATYTGTLNLADGLSIDVSNMTLGEVGSSVTLLSTENGNLGSTDISKLTVDFGSVSPAPEYSLSLSGNDLVLTLGAASNELIWDNHAETGKWNTTDGNWHVGTATAGSSLFKTNDDVKFTAATPNATVTMDGAITAGSMTVAEGATVTIATSTGNTLNAAEGITVENGAAMILQGTGVTGELSGDGVVVGNAIAADGTISKDAVLGNLSLGSDWSGTVVLSGGAPTTVQKYTLLDNITRDFSQGDSTIRMNDVYGYFQAVAVGANLELTGNGADGTGTALTITAGNNNATTTFSGSISGNGDLVYDKNGTGVNTYKFTGDISGWNGKLTNANRSTGSLTVQLADNANVVNADIVRVGNRVMNVTVSNNATFNGDVTDVNNFSVNSGSSATLNALTRVAAISGNGDIEVGSTGTLALTNTTAITFGGDLGVDGTLKLAGSNLLTTGTLDFGNDAILDLTNIHPGESTDPITLVSTTGGITGTLSEVELTHLDAPEGYRGVLTQDNKNLVLTFEMIAHDLIWNTGSGDWDVNKTQQWHMAEDLSTNVVFNQNDNVKFETGTSTATLTEDINAGTMTLDNGANLTLATGTNNLTTKDFVATGGASLVKNGTGAVQFGNAAGGADTLQSLTVNDGDISFEGKVTVTGNLSTDNATNDDSVVFNGGLTVNDTVNALHGNIVVGGTGESSIKNLDISRGGGASNATLTVKDGASLGIGTNMWMGTNAKIELEDGSVKLLNTIQASSLESGESTVTRTGGEAHYSTEHNEFVITNAAVTSLANATIGNKLVNSTLTSAHDVTLNNAANSLTSTTVTANTLTVSAGMNLGAVTVNDGATLALTSSSPVTIGSGTIAGTLSLANPSQFSVNDGVFTFASGSTLDLSSLSITEGTPVTLATATGSGSFSPIGLRGVELDFGEQTYENARLAVEGNSLVLTFVEPGRDLVWQGGPGTWDTASDNKVWFESAESQNKVAFESHDNVEFKVAIDSPVTIGEPQISAGNVTIDAGVNVTLESEGSHLDANEITVDGNLTVRNVAISADSMVINEGGHATANVEGSRTGALATDVSGAGDVTKMGTGNLALTGDNSGFTGTLTIEQGTVVAGSAKALGDTPNVVLAGGNLAGANGVTVAPTGAINITSTQDATVSANLEVAEGATLTFNTINQVNEQGEPVTTTLTESGVISGSGSIVKDGTGTLVLANDNTYTGGLDINHGTVLVSNVGALGGEGSQRVNVSDGGSLKFDSAVSGMYTADYIALDRGSVLTFAGENQLDIDTLYLTAASAVDLSNITVDHYGSYVLADVDHLYGAEPGIFVTDSNENPDGIVQFISMVNFKPTATPTWSLQDNDLISLHYKNGQLTLDVRNANTPAYYWKPSDDPKAVGSWNTSDSVWYSNAGFTGATKQFTNTQGTASAISGSVYFLDAGTDHEEHISLDIPEYTYVRDVIVAGGRYIDPETGEEKRSKFYFTGPYTDDSYFKMDVNRLSNFVVRGGTEAHLVNALVNDGAFDVIHVCKDAVMTIDDTETWGVYSINNEGEFYVDSDLGGIENIMGHVDNYKDMVIHFNDTSDVNPMTVGQVENRQGASLIISAPSLYGDIFGAYGDGILHNEGDLVFDVTGYDVTGLMETYLPIHGAGTFATTGPEATVFLGSEVLQGSVELGAMLTELAGEVVTDATTVDAGATALFEGGGSLGDVTLAAAEEGDAATIQFAGYYGDAKEYVADSVTAGTDSVFDVQGDAKVTIGGYNADLMSDVPTGTIVVGDVEGEVDPAHLVVNGVTKADTLDVQSGAADLNGNAIVSTLTQSGGTANLNAGGYVGGGTVSGGTLAIGNGKVLTLGDVITETGSYTVAATTGSINADALELEKDMENAGYVEVHHDAKTDDQSGFLSGGEQYVKVFDIKSGTLTGNNVTVTHKDAAGPMTLISSGDFAGYGYLDTSKPVYTTYYVRDNYVTGDAGTRGGDDRGPDYVTLGEVIETAEENKTALAAVVFDQTAYNDGENNVHGSITVDVQGQHADLFHVTEDTVGVVNIGNDAQDKPVVLLCGEDYAGVDGDLKLAGTGIYQIENRGDLGANVSLLYPDTEDIGHWTGTVRLIGAAEEVNTAPLSVGEGTTASTIEFNQWHGSFLDTEDPMQSDAKILLTGTGVQGDPAITLTEVEGGANLLWTNTVSGEGGRIDHSQAGDFTLTMTGDTSAWTGTFNQAAEGTTVTLGFLDNVSATGEQSASVLASAGTMDVTYGGNVKTVNGDAVVYGTGDMKLAYTGTNMQVNSNISKYQGEGTLDITVGDGTNAASATFNGSFTNTEDVTMTVENNSTATFDTDAELLRVVGDTGSNVVVNTGNTLSLASADPLNFHSQFYGVDNEGTIKMKAEGGDIKLIDTASHTDAFNLGDLVLTDEAGTAAIETSGVAGKTTEVDIKALSNSGNANQVLKLTNDNATGTVNYNLGGEDSTADFTGKIAYGVNGGNNAQANLVIKGANTTDNSVLESTFADESPATANIVVDTDAAKVIGLSSDGNSANKTMVVSGSSGDNKSLEITGDDNYEYDGKLGENLDITYSGDGKQTIAGGVANFNGKVTVDNGSNAAGVLEILNATSVDITELTIGANNTLDLNDGSNVGTAVVSGKLFAKGGSTTGGTGTASKIDGSLTLGSGSTYDVSTAGGTGGLNLNGALTIEEGAQLSSSDISTLMGLEIDDIYDLAFGVKDVNFGEGVITQDEHIDASLYFTNLGKGEYYLCYTGVSGSEGSAGSNVGTVYLYKAMPEPTTSTLSLLALAALAARRRRKG